MINMIMDLLSYEFIRRALFVGVLVAVCSALLGVSLVLRRYSMIGDGLSHVGFGAMSVALAMNVAPLAVSIPVVILAAFLMLRISENSKIKGDAVIALISSSSIALGVIVTSLTSGLNVDVYSYMFGSIYSISKDDAWIAGGLACVVIIIWVLFFDKIFAVTFDESFASATGTKSGVWNTVIALLTAITVVVGMRVIGTLLISSLIIFPVLTSMQVFKSYKSVTISAACVSVAAFVIGVAVSFAFSTPTAATVVVTNLVCFGLFCLIGGIRKGSRKNG
ncbi:MAG: metal ABC transporter permease [Clostridia bacterium]|nr:metal ABC transporter permease [Clostridia bacterium]